MCHARASHSYKACGSICDWEQNEIKVLICAKSSDQGMMIKHVIRVMLCKTSICKVFARISSDQGPS